MMRLLGRIRSLVRPRWLFSAFVVPYLATELLWLWLVRWQHVPANWSDVVGMLRLRDSLLLVVTFVYGASRVACYHPVCWSNYGNWLARTPWSIAKPLPLGPVRLAFRDVVVVGIVMLAMHDTPFSVLLAPLMFFLGYYLLHCSSQMATGAKPFAYALAFGLGIVIRLVAEPWAALVAAALLYPIAYFGLQKSLAGFPWSNPRLTGLKQPANLWQQDVAVLFNQARGKILGWPFDLVRPQLSPSRIGYVDGTLVSLLLGWWVYVVAAVSDQEFRQCVIFLTAFVLPILIAAARLLRYCSNYRPPISFFGRIFTLRWIIPGHDKVYLAPLAAATIPIATIVEVLRIDRIGPAMLFVAPICAALSMFIILNCGPTLECWRLTGLHRVAPTRNRQILIEL